MLIKTAATECCSKWCSKFIPMLREITKISAASYSLRPGKAYLILVCNCKQKCQKNISSLKGKAAQLEFPKLYSNDTENISNNSLIYFMFTYSRTAFYVLTILTMSLKECTFSSTVLNKTVLSSSMSSHRWMNLILHQLIFSKISWLMF